MKTNTIKVALKTTLTMLALTIVTFAFSGCDTSKAASGTHNMGSGSNRSYIPMADRNMPGR